MSIVKTEDGSNTLLHKSINEHYHSIHGALQESLHVFIKNGLDLIENKTEINVFEMGFGTGLNALLAYDYAVKNKVKINYFSIEAYPINLETAQNLNYDNLIDKTAIFMQLHKAKWDELVVISPNFNLYKIEGFIEKTDLGFLPLIDIIFYDAFAPSAQEHLWEIDILQKMYQTLNTKGLFTTYCAKGQFKRNLKAVGFTVKGVPGPPGKREMTLAFKE